MMTLKQISLLPLSFIIVACGGGGSEPSSNPSTGAKQIAIAAQNVERKMLVGETELLDLNDLVVASEGSVTLAQAPTLIYGDSSCELSVNGNSFAITSNEVNDCAYQYQVNSSLDQSSQAKGYVRLNAATTAENNTLPPIAKSLTAVTPQKIRLSGELASLGFDVSEYRLKSVEVIGDNGMVSIENNDRELETVSIINADGVEEEIEQYKANDVILYTPEYSTEGGVVTMFYTYEQNASTTISSRNSDVDTTLKSGTIYVSVSDSLTRANSLPKAESFTLSDRVDANATITIDVANYISDDNEGDGVQNDTLQLVDVQSVNNTLSIISGSNFDSTKFTFKSSVSGRHDVLYTVHDHYGGYASALVTINVGEDDAPVQLLDWENITLPTVNINNVTATNLTFMAPLDKAVADLMNVSYQAIKESSLGDGGVIAMNYAYATDYCAIRGGRLPTKEEFQKLYDSSLDDVKNKLDKWPKGESYWTLDRYSTSYAKQALGAIKISLANKQQENISTDYPVIGKQYENTNYAYVSCIRLDENTPRLKLSSVPSYNNGKYIITSTVLMPYGQQGVNQLLYMTVEQTGGRLSISESIGGYYGADYERAKGWIMANTNGVATYTYLDESFNPQVISIRNTGSYQAESLDSTFLELISLVPLEDDNEDTSLVPLNSSDWYRLSSKSLSSPLSWTSGLYPARMEGGVYTGLPTWLTTGNNSKIVNIYTKNFNGNTYTIRMKISAKGENTPTTGTISLQLTNAGDRGITGTDNQVARTLMAGDDIAGLPDVNDFSFHTKLMGAGLHFGPGTPVNYLNQVSPWGTQPNGFVQINNGWAPTLGNMDVGSLFGYRQKDIYIWFVGTITPQFSSLGYHGNTAVYISHTPYRPKDPLATLFGVPGWMTFMPGGATQPTRFSITAQNTYDSAEATMNNTYIESIDVRFSTESY